jgi:hypothetical protein
MEAAHIIPFFDNFDDTASSSPEIVHDILLFYLFLNPILGVVLNASQTKQLRIRVALVVADEFEPEPEIW